MWTLPKYRNYIIEYQTGDGFRHVLGSLLESHHLYIANKMMTTQTFDNRQKQCRCVTIHSLHKLVNSDPISETAIVLDTTLPRIGSRAFQALKDVCTGRSLILLHPPLRDIEMMNSLMTILPVTKYPGMNPLNWSKYMYRKMF